MRCWFLIMNLFALWSIQHLPVCSDKRKFGLVNGFALFYLCSYKNGRVLTPFLGPSLMPKDILRNIIVHTFCYNQIEIVSLLFIVNWIETGL